MTSERSSAGLKGIKICTLISFPQNSAAPEKRTDKELTKEFSLDSGSALVERSSKRGSEPSILNFSFKMRTQS